jgi:nucleotide-binding universal stress UspA family protein
LISPTTLKVHLRYAVNFAKLFDAEIILVYVVEPVIYPPDFSMGQIAIPTVTTEFDDRAKEELNKLAKNEIPSQVKVSTVIKSGKPFVEIIDTAVETGCGFNNNCHSRAFWCRTYSFWKYCRKGCKKSALSGTNFKRTC